MEKFGKIFARRIHDGAITIEDVPGKYQTATRIAYKQLYGVDLED